MNETARRAGFVCLAGATLQVGYGVLAVAFPYPDITEPGYELLWAVANLGMVAGILGLLALDAGRPRRLALLGGALALVGHVARIVISLVLVARPETTAVDGPIAATVLLMLGGMAVLAGTVVRGGVLAGRAAWAPSLTVVTGIVTASVYSIDKVVHFALLGLLWGSAWLLLSAVVLRAAGAPAHRSEALA